MTSQIKYRVFVKGSVNPIYQYVTDKNFYARLKRLALQKALTKIYVHVSTTGKWYQVNLNPEPDCLWTSREMGNDPL